MSWEEVEEASKQCALPKGKLVEAVKYLECVGHIMYFPGSEDNKKRIKSPMVGAENILVGQKGSETR